MATKAEISLPNFASGELSPSMWGRFDLPIYYSGCERMLNFLAETQGAARYRTGTKYVHHTRRNNVANLISFQFNDQQAYVLEFTDKFMRIHKDGGVVTESTKAITGITAANPGVITSVAHGYVTGDEIFITGIVGMTELNDQYFLVVKINNNTYSLTDQDGTAINTTAFTAYSSAGTTARIVEVATPYDEDDDLFKLEFTQNADTMYLVHPFYEPRKLTRSSHTSWSLVRFTRTADPFLVGGTGKAITGISQANPGNVTAVAHGFATGDIIIIEGVVGMTQVNSRYYTITVTGVDNFTIGVDTSAYTAWSSGGIASPRNLLPAAVAFYESRLAYGGSGTYPAGFWLSRSPSGTGVTRYDDFTTGTDADHSVQNTIAQDEVNKILWLSATDRFLCAGTFGSEVKITGSPEDTAIAPDSIKVTSLNSRGVAYALPIKEDNSILYVDRTKRTLWSLEFDPLADGFVSVDRNLVSDHITKGNIKQIAYQHARPDVVWAITENGELLGVTYKSREDVSGWHRHRTNNGDDLFESISIMPQPAGFDQVWVVVKRTVNGIVRRYVEYFAPVAEIPVFEDFYTTAENYTDDLATFLRAMFEAQKSYIHVDSALSYDGSELGLAAGATMTPAAVSGTSVVFTASAAVFKSTDVGRQIWKKAIDGVGYGRAEITGYTSSTQVTCNILKAFNNTTAMAAGSWYLTTDEITLADHLEAREVAVVTDGSAHDDVTVADGVVALTYQASVVHVGMGYGGILKSMSLEGGGVSGASQTKPKNIYKVGVRFLNTLGAYYGTDLYHMQQVQFRSSADATNRPSPLFSGDKEVQYSDNWQAKKHIIIQQKRPLPCTVQLLVPYIQTSNS